MFEINDKERKMKVLSLFDGISCGMVALERAGIPVEKYVAYEIEPNAIKISEKNYPQIKNSIHFDFDEFWETMRQWSKNNYVLISELAAPDDFICVWSKDVQRSMKSTDSTIRAVEKLFTYKSGLYERNISRSDINDT